jgi:hypothetical protein
MTLNREHQRWTRFSVRCATLVCLAGSTHLMAQGGSVVQWGVYEVNPPAGNFVSVSAGLNTAIAIRPDGTLVEWELVCGFAPPGETFIAAAAGRCHTVGLRPDGSVLCWGSNPGTCPTEGVFTKVAAGYNTSAAIRSDGAIVVWGDNAFYPVPEGVFLDVGVATHSFSALRADGQVVTWGQFPPTPPTGTFAAISVSKSCFGIGIRTDGTLAHWGCPGNGANLVPPGEFVQVAAGAGFAFARRADGTLVHWGTSLAGIGNIPPGRYLQVAASESFGLAILACYPNCDESSTSPALSANDFLCFINRYATQDPRDNCDQTTSTPLLTANDFLCFLNAYVAGCS